MIRNLKHNKNKILFSIILAGLMVILPNKRAFASPVPDPPNPDLNWTHSNAIIKLHDNGDVSSLGVSNVNRIEYKLSGVRNQDWITYNNSLKITDEGATVVLARVLDNAGNYSVEKSQIVRIDKSAPNITLEPEISTSTNAITKINVTATDMASGVKRIQLPNGTWVNGNSASYSISSNGMYTFVAEDNSGLQSTKTVAIKDPIPDPVNPAQDWVNSNVLVKLSDNEDVLSAGTSEVNRIEYKLSGAKNQDWTAYNVPVKITDEGITLISSRVVDNAGNYSNVTCQTVKIDKSAPYLLVQADNSLLATPTVKIKVNATDIASGIKRIQLPDGNWTTNTSLTYEVSKDGVYTFVAEDVYGFRTTQAISINNISRNTLITNKPQVKLKLGADDSLSGITQMQFRNENGSWSPFEPYATLKHWTVANGDGLKHVWVQYADQVGNISQIVEDTVILDTTAPTIQSFTINGGKQHTNNKNVLLRVNATDNLTGMKSLMISNDGVNWITMNYTTNDIPWTLTNGDGLKTVYLKASDIAGNVTALNTSTIFVDTVKPTASIIINNGDAYTATRDVNLTLNFADNIGGSGIAQVKVIEGSHSYIFPTVPSSPVTIPWTLDYGVVRTVSVQVTDKAGNVSNLASDDITVDKLTINNFTLTNVVNPISFTESNPYKGLVWSFKPQPMMAGGNISFNLNVKAPYESAVVKDSATFKVDIIGNNGYHKVIMDSLDNKTSNNYSKTITLPVDAPKDAKVYASCVATRKLLVSPYDTQTAYFPGSEASTQAQIGYIQGNIYQAIKFNETN